MIQNYFKTTIRSLWKNRGYSFLNIFGLSIGIACAALIFLWVEDELTFDNNHVKKDRLFQVNMNNDVDAGVFTHASTPEPMAKAMQKEIPGIANSIRVTEGSASQLFSTGEKSVYASGRYADPAIFSMFTLPFIEGNAASAFSQLYSMVITKKTAYKFFGNDKNIVGKTIRVDNSQDYVVSGVLEDLPDNTSLQFEWLAPFQVYFQTHPGMARWTNFGTTTYVELKQGVDPLTINKKLLNYIQVKQGSETSTSHPFLFSMNDWRLRNDFDNGKSTGGGRIQYVHLFSIIAWIILFIACINFMNLSTARSEKRAREVGVRKVLGAGKRRLVFQFIGEALFMAFIGAVVAVAIMVLALQPFNALVQKNLSLGFGVSTHILSLVLITLICGLVAGSYPSLYLSSFNPVFVLKGIKLKTGGAAAIRKGLVIVQFTISIVLIIGTIVIYKQIQHVKSRDLGYNKDNLVQLDATGNIQKDFTAIRQDLINTGAVTNAALADHETISGGNNTTSIYWPGKLPNSLVVISQRLVSTEFMSTAGMHLSDGRDFLATDVVKLDAIRSPNDSVPLMNIIITKSLEELMGKGTAVGKTLSRETDKGVFHMVVVGVVKDYVYGDMYRKSAPVVFYAIPQAANLLYVRTKARTDPATALAKIEAVMKKDNPAFPFTYRFVDDQFNARFLSEMLISQLSKVFATLAIIISCLGLFGLATYTAERRTKEIGVRKVLGASVPNIAGLLSKDFLKLVVISCLIAFPISWYIMSDWLLNYQYRIEISWLIFLAAGIMAILIALSTVGFQAIRAAVANPVKSLRTE